MIGKEKDEERRESKPSECVRMNAIKRKEEKRSEILNKTSKYNFRQKREMADKNREGD